MREVEEKVPEEAVENGVLAFAAFALNHAACGDGVFEVRLGERCVLEWCASCAAMRVFVTPVGRRVTAQITGS